MLKHPGTVCSGWTYIRKETHNNMHGCASPRTAPSSGRCTCGKSVQVWCDMETDGGGWTVFLNRQEQSSQLDFNRTWEEYKEGFGRPYEEYWMGGSS